MKPLLFSMAERVAAGSLRVWMIVGILLRITRLKDRFHPLAVVYYTTPWPAVAVGMAVLALHAALRRQRHVTRRYVILCGGAIFIWFATSWQSTAPTAETPSLRVALWNTARPGWRLGPLAGWLRAQQADIIAIAEAEGRAKVADWAKKFPEYQAQPLNGEMLCLVRGEILSCEESVYDAKSYYAVLKVRVRGEDLTVLQADINGAPLHSQRLAVERLVELAHAHAGERLIVLGDLNTPRDSALFQPLRAELTSAFEAAGHGLGETWPMPYPMLSLDHLWSSSRLRPLSCRIGWVWWSDHRPVVAEFAPGR